MHSAPRISRPARQSAGIRSGIVYTALGDAVNVASRLCELGPEHQARVLVNEILHAACETQFAWRALGRVAVRGREAAVELFEPLPPTT